MPRALIQQLEEGMATVLGKAGILKTAGSQEDSQVVAESEDVQELEQQQGIRELEWIESGMQSVLSCGFCSQLLCEPVALICGHSHCRECVKLSLSESPDKKVSCATPGCTSTPLGEREVKKLKVSITTRDIVAKLFPIQSSQAAASAAEKTKKPEEDKQDGKRMQSPFIVFCTEHRQRVKDENPGASFGELGKILGGAWRALTQEQKDQYKRRG